MKRTKSLPLMTVLIIFGLLISYICQMSPSPFLNSIKADYAITAGDSVLNLAVSVIYPTLILASFFGSEIERRIGTYKMFVWILVLLSIGILFNFISVNFAMFLIGRAIFGFGFGLGIPFIGSAIMQLYDERRQQTLNTVNALFPFFGTLISFALLIPCSNALPGGWKSALGIWGIGTVATLILWALFVRPEHFPSAVESASEASATEPHLYRNLLKRKEIFLLCIVFMCDYFCYSYIVTILPTMLMEQCQLSESVASLMAALTFPGVGCIGCLLGGAVSAKSGHRKPSLVLGVALEVAGIFLCTLLADVSSAFVYIGIAAFAFGNGYWLPVLYQIPMDLPDMNPARVGASFAITSICAFVCGFISPSIGGWLTDLFASSSQLTDSILSHAHGLRWSLFAFGFVNVIGLIAAISIRETGSVKEPAQKS